MIPQYKSKANKWFFIERTQSNLKGFPIKIAKSKWRWINKYTHICTHNHSKLYVDRYFWHYFNQSNRLTLSIIPSNFVLSSLSNHPIIKHYKAYNNIKNTNTEKEDTFNSILHITLILRMNMVQNKAYLNCEF